MRETLTKGTGSGAHERRLGRYTLFDKLPAYGTVQPYVGRADGEVELVVVKRLLVELSTEPTARQRFRREARIATELRHPNLVQAFEEGVDGDVHFLVTEWIRGVSLHAVLQRLRELKRRLPLEVFGLIALRIMQGLSYAHAATDRQGLPLGIVHRDMAPHSVLLGFAGDVKIADFGVARLRADEFQTQAGMAVGSIPYMSPEQAQGRELDARSDQYTLGVLLYEMLTRRRAVADARMLTMLRAVVGEEPPPLASVRPDLPPMLVQAVQRAMAKERDERWPDVATFAAALQPHLPTVPDPTEVLSRFTRKLLPEHEAEAVAFVKRVRDHAEVSAIARASSISEAGRVVPAALDEAPEREKATQVVRSRKAAQQEPQEPSVMTMPGAPVPQAPGLSAARPHPAPPERRASSRRVRVSRFSIGVGVLALFFGAAAWWVSASLPGGPAASGAVSPPLPAPQPHPESVAPAAVTARPQVTEAPPSVSVSPADPVAAKARARRVSAPRDSSPPAPRPAPAPAPVERVAPVPPPEPSAPANPRAAQLASLSRRVQALKSSPQDILAFEALHRDLLRVAKTLPDREQQTQVKATLGAAERTFEVELLDRALQKIIRANAP